MRVFIIGGTGFLGTYLVNKLAEHGHDITVLTRSSEKAPSLLSRNVKAVVGDLLQPESFVAELTSQDVVISVAMPDISPERTSGRRFRTLRKQTTAYFSTSIETAENNT